MVGTESWATVGPDGSPDPLWSGVPMWRPVRGGNAFEITVSRLAQVIRLGLVDVGQRLPAERELAERLQVSRMTLREAIRALREAGYLESRRGRGGGTFVVSRSGVVAAPRSGEVPRSRLVGVPRSRSGGVPAPRSDEPPLSRSGPVSVPRVGVSSAGVARAGRPAAELARQMGDGLHDALAFRRVVEPGAAGLAAGRTLAEAERRQLGECLAASRERAPAIRRVSDSRLHLAIAGASGSPTLAAAVADVQLTLDRLLAAIPVIPRNLDHSDDQHARVVRAILVGDADGARAAMEEHCDATAELLYGLLG